MGQKESTLGERREGVRESTPYGSDRWHARRRGEIVDEPYVEPVAGSQAPAKVKKEVKKEEPEVAEEVKAVPKKRREKPKEVNAKAEKKAAAAVKPARVVARSTEVEASTSTLSTTSSEDKSTGSSSKGSRRGTWEYVEATPRVFYPKVRKGAAVDRRAREIAKLAMDVVDSQHDLGKAPEEWYEDSPFDPSKPLSMADRIKLNRRLREERNARSPPADEPKEKRPRKARVTKPKDAAKSEATAPIPIPSPREIEDTECGRPDSLASSCYSEELGMPFDALMEDIRQRQDTVVGAAAPSVIESEERGEVPSLLSVGTDLGPLPHSVTYSLTPLPAAFPTEMPEDILEESTDIVIDSAVVEEVRLAEAAAAAAAAKKSSHEDLRSLKTAYNEHGVEYRPRLLCLRPLSEETSMEQFITSLEAESFVVVSTLDPHAVLIAPNVQQAEDLLAKGKIAVDADFIAIEQPGSVFVRSNDELAPMGEEAILKEVESTMGLVLATRVLPSGIVVLLSSIDKATEFVRAGSVGRLTVSSLRSIDNGDCQTSIWPYIDSD